MLAASGLALARHWLHKSSRGGDLWKKYPSYILLNLTFLAAGWAPKETPFLTMLLIIIGGAASWEFAQASLPKDQASGWLSLITAGLIAGLGMTNNCTILAYKLTPLMAAGVLLMLSVSRRYTSLQTVPALITSLFYLPFSLGAYRCIHALDSGPELFAFIYLVVATNDAFAQITGELFGQRRLAPQISPAKTIEGAAGGIMAAGAMGAALSFSVGWTLSFGLVMGIATGAAGLVGDLLASAWKRNLDLDNFSGLLGAHGGVLDRFDSLLFAVPIFYFIYG